MEGFAVSKLGSVLLAGTLLLPPSAVAAAADGAVGPEIRLAAYRFDPLREMPALPAGLVRAEGAPAAEVHLVQLHGPVTAEARAVLESAGELLGYIPESAFLIRHRNLFTSVGV